MAVGALGVLVCVGPRGLVLGPISQQARLGQPAAANADGDLGNENFNAEAAANDGTTEQPTQSYEELNQALRAALAELQGATPWTHEQEAPLEREVDQLVQTTLDELEEDLGSTSADRIAREAQHLHARNLAVSNRLLQRRGAWETKVVPDEPVIVATDTPDAPLDAGMEAQEQPLLRQIRERLGLI